MTPYYLHAYSCSRTAVLHVLIVLRYIDCHIPNRTQPGHCTRATHHHRTGDSRMVSRLVVIVHVLKVQNAPRPVRFSRVNTHLGASSCHQHGECVPPRRRELRRRPVVQVHITILVVRLGNATCACARAGSARAFVRSLTRVSKSTR